tara:strand:+ start:1827 stop:2876 length:1050 start_codon:yes stop_codon:yes gene_type:complete
MKPILAFYMGYSESFNGSNYNSKNVFGSEINALKLAESLVDTYDVYIFVNIDSSDEIIYNQVHYLNLYKISDFKNLDILIIVRYINYFLYNHHHAQKTILWICDTIINPVYNGDRLPNNASHLIHNFKDKINHLVFLSDWHIQNNSQIIDLPLFNNHIIYNPIDLTYYKSNIPIIKNRFIYMSDPNRGLSILLDCLIYIQKHIPNISLVVFREQDFSDEIKNKIKLIHNHKSYTKVSQQIIADECLQAEYFFYPTNFYETFCNCAAEAQLYNTICIYNPIGGLTTTIADRGYIIHHDINSSDYIINTSLDVIQLMNNESKKNDYRTRGHLWAKQLSLNNIKHQWIKLFK